MSSKRGRSEPGGRAPKKRVTARAKQAEADEQWRAQLARFYLRRRRQKMAGTVLGVLGLVVILNHFLVHVNAMDLLGGLLSTRTQDVLIGFPMGAVLLFGAVVFFGQSDEPPKRPVR